MIQTQSSEDVSSIEFFVKIMERNDIHLIIPVFYNAKLVALLVLGKRDLNNSSYIGDEIDFLESLASITGISLVRAVLYEQVEDLNRNLQAKVSEQTFELQKKVKELEEARRKEADMIDIMGHELRTPMSVIKLNTDLLTRFQKNIEQNKETFLKYVSRIKDSVETEIVLINTLLSSAKLEGDKIELNLDKVDLNQQIKMSMHAHEIEAKQKGVDLDTSFDYKKIFIYADHARTVEILNNLISNAIKYTDKGKVSVEVTKNDSFAKVSVIDTGQGIPKEDLSKLGTKFFRTRNYLTNPSDKDGVTIVRPGGTGLGLYVTFNLVKKMGGQIYVQSEVGKGSTFTFTLPLFRNQERRTDDHDSKDMFARMGLKK
jgi:signal transduction histidine kinase